VAEASQDDGFSVRAGGQILDCSANGNGGDGFALRGDTMIQRCVSTSNNSAGIVSDGSMIAIGCLASRNGTAGISAGAAAMVKDCVAAGNGDVGIDVGTLSQVRNCAVKDAGAVGINALDNAIIEGCTVNNSGSSAIVVRHRSLVMNNECDFQSVAAGIRVIGKSSRIDGNNVSRNLVGVEVTAPGNIIVRNTASDNTSNYEIVASNRVGQIFVAPASVAISGSVGGGFAGIEDPWANICY